MNDPDRYRQGEAETLLDVIAGFEAVGFTGQLGVRDGITCFTCRSSFVPADAHVSELRRLEGASDPADMLAVVALRCPHCGTAGTLVVNYGPEASTDDGEVLAGIGKPEHAPGPTRVSGS